MSLFEKARRYYEKGWWTLAVLEALVEKGKLTQEQVAEITGTSTDVTRDSDGGYVLTPVEPETSEPSTPAEGE